VISDGPVVTVIVPMYNVEDYIDECLASIVAQDCDPLEIVVVDDGSSDSSATRAASLAAIDHRVRVITQLNQGVSAARNAGLATARGEFVCFVDSDDWLDPSFVTNQLETARATGADFVVSTAPGSPLSLSAVSWSGSHAVAELLTADIPIGCWNKLYRREFLNRAGIAFQRDLYMGEGLYFIAECARKAEIIAAIGPVGYHYRRDNNQSATSVPSVEKMRNALESISKIDDLWCDGDNEVQVALTYQRLWTLFAGLVDAVELRDAAAMREFASGIRSVDSRTPIRASGGPLRRAKAMAFRVAPVAFAHVAAHRRKLAH